MKGRVWWGIERLVAWSLRVVFLRARPRTQFPGGSADTLSISLLTKHIKALKKKIRRFEEQFEQERNYRVSANKYFNILIARRLNINDYFLIPEIHVKWIGQSFRCYWRRAKLNYQGHNIYLLAASAGSDRIKPIAVSGKHTVGSLRGQE